MIRLFTAFIKVFSEKISVTDTFTQASRDFNYYDAMCPKCGAAGSLKPHGSYTRNLVYFVKTFIACDIDVLLFMCTSCGKTHALLPDVLIPHSQYSLSFMLAVLIAYYERKSSVVKICELYNIAVSTLYEWKKRLEAHKHLMVKTYLDSVPPTLDFIFGLFSRDNSSETLRDFFRTYGFSFMQRNALKTSRSNPP